MTKFISDEQIDSWFAYHPPSTPQIAAAHEEVRAEFGMLATYLNDLLPECPDKTVALRAVREAMYHANACIAVNQALMERGGPELVASGLTATADAYGEILRQMRDA